MMLCCCPNLSIANGSSFREQLDAGLQPAAKTPPDTHQARLLFMGCFCPSWKGHSQNLFHCLPISALFQQRLPRTREDSTDMGSHLTPSSPLTCSTLEEQEEEGEQQVQDLHAWSRSSQGCRVDEQRQQGHGRTETAQKPGHSDMLLCTTMQTLGTFQVVSISLKSITQGDIFPLAASKVFDRLLPKN